MLGIGGLWRVWGDMVGVKAWREVGGEVGVGMGVGGSIGFMGRRAETQPVEEEIHSFGI